MKWYIKVLKKYAVFTGRASRQEFWMFMLINSLIILGLSLLPIFLNSFTGTDQNILNVIYHFAVLIPFIAVYVRRMHDTGRSGWWSMVPIVCLIFAIEDGQQGENKYGPDPKQMTSYR